MLVDPQVCVLNATGRDGVEQAWSDLSRELPLVVLCTCRAAPDEGQEGERVLSEHPYWYVGGEFVPGGEDLHHDRPKRRPV